MFASLWAAPLHFTVELAGFVVFAGGAVLAATRPELVPGGRGRRAVVCAGFAAVAAAQVLHGAGLAGARPDGAAVGVALRGVGAGLIAAALAGAGARVGAVLAGARVRDPVLLIPTVAWGLVAVACARAGRGLWRLALAAALLSVAEALTALAPRADFDAGVVPTLAYAAHGARLAGFAVTAAWLWRAARASVRTRFVGAFAVLLVAVVLALSGALSAVISGNVAASQLASVANQLRVTRAEVQEGARALLDQTSQIAALPDVRRRIVAGAAGELAPAIRDLEFFEVDFVAVLDRSGLQLSHTRQGPYLRRPTGELVARPLRRTDVLRLLGSPVVQDLLEGSGPSASFDVLPGRDIPLVLAGAPVHSEAGSVAGYLVTARYLDLLALQEIASSLRPVEASVIVDGRLFATTLPEGASARSLLSGGVRARLNLGEVATGEHVVGRRSYFSALAPLTDSLGAPTGAVLALSAPSALVADTRRDVISVLFVIALAAGVVVLLLAWLSGRRITRPIQELTRAAAAVREGDLSVSAPVTGEDEVGELGRTFNQMTASLARVTRDLRAAAREEQELRQRIEKIIQSMADGLVAVDAGGRVLAFNAEAEVMTGRDVGDVLGRPVSEVLQVVDAQGHPVVLPIHGLGEGAVGGVFLKRRRGDPVPVTITSAALRDEQGTITGCVAVVRDMTREREVERMKTEFLSNISHELRTPLTPVKGYAELLATRDVPQDKVRRFATSILEATERLERIVGLLLDFAALEAGRLAPSSRPVEVPELVEELRARWDARSPRHRVVAEVEDALPPVMGDRRLLRRTLDELLDNAVKFSPDGGTVQVVARRGAGATVEIAVCDQGIGIAADDLARVFSDFQQVDGSETRPFGGLGLGLAFARRIVEAHGGSVEVDSAPERGTRVFVVIPAAQTTTKAAK